MGSKWIAQLLIMLGLGVISYCALEIYNERQQVSQALVEAKEIISDSVEVSILETDEEKKVYKQPFQPQKNDIIGVVVLPLLNQEYPIIVGTDELQLSKGVGHYIGSKYPGEKGQIILSGHRDTVFKEIGTLEAGDEIVLQVEYGTFSYYIDKTYIVDADDTTVINFEIDEETLLLTTCYPFRFVGNAPQRYVIEARPKKPLLHETLLFQIER